SLTDPGSVATIFRTCPDASSLRAFFVLRMGRGQDSPRASSSLLNSTSACLRGAKGTRRRLTPSPLGVLQFRNAPLCAAAAAPGDDPRRTSCLPLIKHLPIINAETADHPRLRAQCHSARQRIFEAQRVLRDGEALLVDE